MPYKERLLFRWGVWMTYSEWRPDQPHETWDGSLSIAGGRICNPNQVIYHGHFGPKWRTYIRLDEPQWTSPRLEFRRGYGYLGLEGLTVDVEGDENTVVHFCSEMIDAEFRLGDIPPGGKLTWHIGSKYSCSELAVCRIEDEGVYWNEKRVQAAMALDGRWRQMLDLGQFRGQFLRREMHHRIGAWIPGGGTLTIPFKTSADCPDCPVIVTWRFTGSDWALSTRWGQYGPPPLLEFTTSLDGVPLSRGKYLVKHTRGEYSALEHTDELGRLSGGQEHCLAITNHSTKPYNLILYPLALEEMPHNWPVVKQHLPFRAPWPAGNLSAADTQADIPSRGRGVIVGYDTNMMAAENGWIDAVIRWLAISKGGNYILFRTENDLVTAGDWRRWFNTCRDNEIYFAVNDTLIERELTVPQILELASALGGDYFLGVKQHELSRWLYGIKHAVIAGRSAGEVDETITLSQVERSYLEYVANAYAQSGGQTTRLLGEAMLAQRYAYKAGVDLILSETMTGHTCLLLAAARGAARAYRRRLWGVHIACHINCSPEDWRHERMLWLNLYLSYLTGATIIEDEEGGLAKVHSFVSGPSDPLPAARQKIIAEFYRWAAQRPRRTTPLVEIGFLYGRHEAITGGLNLNQERPVRVWETFGPAISEWEYRSPEYGWLLLDAFMPGVWLAPILRDDPGTLRRWFSGSPYGQVDILPLEAGDDCLSTYKLLVLPGWNTMNDADMERLIAYVKGGGTLVLGLPQMQTSDDRTRVLSAQDYQFPAPELVERLCGLRVNGPGKLCAEMDDERDGKLRLADVTLTGGRVRRAVDGDPLVVENRLGAGQVYTFTTWSYLGHGGLRPFARQWLDNLAADFPFSTRLHGGEGEVACFVYPDGNKHHVYLINTDWTEAGNIKHCRIERAGGTSAKVTVPEGRVVEILI